MASAFAQGFGGQAGQNFMTILVKNKEAFFNYAIEHELEAGIVLSGQEVKSIKAGNVSLKGAHVIVRGNEVFLVNAHVTPYKYAGNVAGYDPTKARKLLLKRKEISSLTGKYKVQGMAVVPLELKVVKGLIKVKLGIGRGKKKFDKRETIKRREANRKIQRAVRGRV